MRIGVVAIPGTLGSALTSVPDIRGTADLDLPVVPALGVFDEPGAEAALARPASRHLTGLRSPAP